MKISTMGLLWASGKSNRPASPRRFKENIGAGGFSFESVPGGEACLPLSPKAIRRPKRRITPRKTMRFFFKRKAPFKTKNNITGLKKG